MLTIYGASDDLIEVEGDVEEEFGWWAGDGEEERFLACSDGNLFRAHYDDDGIWRFSHLAKGANKCSVEPGSLDKDDNSDVITLSGGPAISWVVLGSEKALARRA